MKKKKHWESLAFISIKDFFIKCDQIRSLPWICSHLLKKSLTENSIFVQWYISSAELFTANNFCDRFWITLSKSRRSRTEVF